MSYRLTILIPVFNEIKTIEAVINKVMRLKLTNFELIVVDDFSSDGTREWLKNKFDQANQTSHLPAQLILHPKNRGKGGAIQSGLSVATGEYFVIHDADLEYDPNDIITMIERAEEENAPAVYGSRFMGSIKNMHPANYVANRFYNILLLGLYRVRLTDMHTCYKMVKTKLFQELEITSEGFGYATEVVSKLLRRKVPIIEVPISFDGRTVEEGKKIGIKDGVECLTDLIMYRVSAKGATHHVPIGRNSH